MNRNNAFDLLRLLLATLVLITHGYLIGGYASEPFAIFTKGQTNLGEIGVMGFFALSGYLIAGSFEKSSNILVYLWHRVLRIFPAYWVCLFVTGLVLAPAIFYANYHTFQGFPFTGSNSSWTYIWKNKFLSINQWSIGNVLNASAYQLSIDGSLWTLFHEFECYLLLMLLGMLGMLNRNRLFLLLFCSFIYLIYLLKAVGISYGPTFLILTNALNLVTSFLCGSMLYVFRDRITYNNSTSLFIIVFALALLKFGGFMAMAPILISVLCIGVFSQFRVSLKYDISYGLYIYAFPVEQLVFNIWGHAINIYTFLIISLVTSCLAGFLSFVLIEKQFLKLK